LTVTPAVGEASTFTYRYGQTHDVRLEAAVRGDLIRLGRTCGGEVLRSTIDHPSPAQPSLLINVAAPGELSSLAYLDSHTCASGGVASAAVEHS
jgi:hypothetical protein